MTNMKPAMNLYGYSPKPQKAKLMRKQAFWASWSQFLPMQNSRRFQAYCVGLPRSGTHSLGYMFAAHYSSQHEPMDDDTIPHILRFLAGNYSEGQWKALLRWRDRQLGLEMEASHYLHHTVSVLAELYPEAKFIHTVREPFSWLASEINQNLKTRSATIKWRALERARYGRYDFEYEPEETALKNLDEIWPVSSYLSYWRDHNECVLKSVPADRLLVLRTQDIRESIDKIAEFLNISPETIDVSASRSGTNPSKDFDLYAHVSPDFVREKIDRHCGVLVQKLFG